MAQSRESEECVCYSEGCQRPCSAPATGPDLICPLHPYNTPRKGKTELRADPFLPFSLAKAAAVATFAIGCSLYWILRVQHAELSTSSCTDCTMNSRKHCNHKLDGPIYPTCDNASHVNMQGAHKFLRLRIFYKVKIVKGHAVVFSYLQILGAVALGNPFT